MHETVAVYLYLVITSFNTFGNGDFHWENRLDTRQLLRVHHISTSFLKHVAIKAQKVFHNLSNPHFSS